MFYPNFIYVNDVYVNILNNTIILILKSNDQ